MREITVGNSFGCDYSTIQEALDAAPEDATIRVKPGVYRENLLFKKRVRLLGSGKKLVETDSNKKWNMPLFKDIPIVVCNKTQSVGFLAPAEVEGIAFSDTGLLVKNEKVYWVTKAKTYDFKGLEDYFGRLRTDPLRSKKSENITSYGSPNYTTLIWAQSDAKLKDVIILNSENCGITFLSGNGELSESMVVNCAGTGICVAESASPSLSNIAVLNCMSDGIVVCGHAKPKITQIAPVSCEVGLNIKDNASPTVENSVLTGSLSAVMIKDSSAPVLEKCRILGKKCGIYVNKDAGGKISGCEISGASDCGLKIKGNAKPQLLNCNIHDNAVGMSADDTSAPKLAECRIYDNTSHDFIARNGAKPDIKDCQIAELEQQRKQAERAAEEQRQQQQRTQPAPKPKKPAAKQTFVHAGKTITVDASEAADKIFDQISTATVVITGRITSWNDILDAIKYRTRDIYLDLSQAQIDLKRIVGGENDETQLFRYLENLAGISLPNGVTEIGERAFYGCTSLRSVVIPEGVTEIGDSAFEDCKSLRSIVIPESVTEIGDFTFNDCTSLESVVIPEGVTKIGRCAFIGCPLKSIEIPSTVREIDFSFGGGSNIFGDDAGAAHIFSCQASLKKIVVSEGNPNYDSRNGCNAIIDSFSGKLILGCGNTVIPSDVTIIGNFAFYGCTSLKNVTIPSSVTGIGIGAYSYCTSLKSVTIPKSVTLICEDAFKGCESLENVTIQNGFRLKGIESRAFFDCPCLKSIIIPRCTKYFADVFDDDTVVDRYP